MKIPKEVKNVIGVFERAGFQAYIVGGCVRDSLMGIKPSDWDITTNAKPEETKKLFPKIFTVDKFGLVTVLTGSKDKTLKEIEVMPFRIEAKYTDKRHPDKVEWTENIEQDLSRRDFTINAMVAQLEKGGKGFKITDLFYGRKDLENKIIRTVGEPRERFSEDALRMMRAVRFSVTLGEDWKIESKTKKALKENAGLLEVISKERVREELMKIIMCPGAMQGIELLRQTGLLTYIIPELEENYGVGQNKHHIYDCYEHAIRSLDYAARQGYNKDVRLAALLHDIAKPRVKEGKGEDATFYNHEVVGARMVKKILRRLRFPEKDIKKITKLVRYHLFYYNVDEVTESSVRKLVKNAGKENIDELLQVRYADRIGSGCPKAVPYKLRHLQYVIDKVARDPISVSMLKVDGSVVMKTIDIEPGPHIGKILDILLVEVLEEPSKNKLAHQKKKIKELGGMSNEELDRVATKARAEIKDVKMKKDDMLKKKYWVR